MGVFLLRRNKKYCDAQLRGGFRSVIGAEAWDGETPSLRDALYGLAIKLRITPEDALLIEWDAAVAGEVGLDTRVPGN